MINCNPETVSTDYDTTDRLYFEPLTFEDVMAVLDKERSAGAEVSCLVQFGGQTPLKLALPLQAAGVSILGTSPDSIDLAEDRRRFSQLLWDLGIPQPASGTATSRSRGARRGRHHRLSRRRAPVVRARRARHGDRLRHGDARPLHGGRGGRLARAARADRQVPRGRVRVRRGLHRRRDRRRRDRRHHGAHRGGRHPLGRQLVRRAAVHGGREAPRHHPRVHAADRAGARGRRADEHAVRDQGRHRLRARGEPPRVAHRALPLEGHGRPAGEDGGAGDERPHARRAGPARRPERGGRVREDARLPVRALPGRGHDPRPRDEVHRRGDGRRRELRLARSRRRSSRSGRSCRNRAPCSSA